MASSGFPPCRPRRASTTALMLSYAVYFSACGGGGGESVSGGCRQESRAKEVGALQRLQWAGESVCQAGDRVGATRGLRGAVHTAVCRTQQRQRLAGAPLMAWDRQQQGSATAGSWGAGMLPAGASSAQWFPRWQQRSIVWGALCRLHGEEDEGRGRPIERSEPTCARGAVYTAVLSTGRSDEERGGGQEKRRGELM